jgi:hypothetical protein
MWTLQLSKVEFDKLEKWSWQNAQAFGIPCRTLLTGFSIPIKVVQLLIFSNNMFLKTTIGTYNTLIKLELTIILN